MRNSMNVGKRYMEAINACPHHGFDTWLLVSYFYDGMSSLMKQLLEMMCGGDFLSKNPEEAMDFLSYVAEVSRGWDEPNAREVGRMKSQPNASNAKAGMYTLNESKIYSYGKKIGGARKCPTIPATREMFGDQANVIGQFKPTNNASYGDTYNSNWRNHLNFFWKPRAPQYTQPGQAPPQALSLEQAIVNLCKVVGDFVGDQKSIMLNSGKKLKKISFSTSSESKGIHEVEAQEGESSQVREVRAVITLRSGKEVDLPTSKPEREPESEAEKEKREKIKGKRKGNSTKKENNEATVNEEPERTINQEEMIKKHMPPPFPQALNGKKGINNA
ncbi:hypothetical protein CK203_064292 [Vitis vinifera]|uniref:Retrotransposon gag domain-containing protein n=1 Tax=Vitis vinifera TaxID=29760 RepID=A0A438G9M4_VITVI|nr:hypothetical protein CK203_064292 [Vitis vinifera]